MTRRTTGRTALLLAAALLSPTLLLAGCSGSDEPAPVEETEQTTEQPAPASPSAAAAPSVPHFEGRRPLVVQAALTSFGSDGAMCEPDAETACSADGSSAYRLVDEPVPVTLVDASTALNEGATAWTTTLTLGAAKPLRATARRAAGIGGVVLLLDPRVEDGAGGTVLVAASLPDVDGATIVMADLDKPAAWGLVDLFA